MQILKTNTYIVLPVADYEGIITTAEVTDPLDGEVFAPAALFVDGDGNGLTGAQAYPNARRSLDGTLVILKGEWTLRQQVGLHLKGYSVLTHAEARALMQTAEWAAPVLSE